MNKPDDNAVNPFISNGNLPRHTSNRRNISRIFFDNSIRYWILISTTLLLTLLYANSTAFNLTIICMIPSAGNELQTELFNITASAKDYYDYTPMHRNGLFSAVAIGSLLGSLPLSFLVHKYNIRYTFSFYAVVSLVSTLALPISARMGYQFIFVARVLQGAGTSPSLMMINSVTERWSPQASAGISLIFLSAHYQFGPIFSMPIAGELCESQWGWPMIYYIQGALTLILLAIFFTFFRDTPREHPCVTDKELMAIEKDKPLIVKIKSESAKESVPYGSILSDPIALGMNVRETGFAAAIPFFVSIITKLIAGAISDRMTCFSERAKINIFSILSQGGTIFCYVCLATIPLLFNNNAPTWLVQIFYVSINMFSGFGFLGLVKAAALVSQQYSHVLMSGEIIITSIVVLILPILMSIFVPDNTVDQWGHIFIGTPLVQIVTISLFLAFCDSKPRPWTDRRKMSIDNSDNDESLIT
ncbi:major facilitator superfamily domain-containing protein [Ditylenchus destructor]|uniref:Major facilitator superfamily domain-containing protein n=1 Tax=Ditylenchus destructor TaxID=166010 RepID=A0AAD4N8D1_9BILA|nr:major facilitator superfamily domain-containing protein [Ditylenchus destructor]